MNSNHQSNLPECSHAPDRNSHTEAKEDTDSIASKELAMYFLDQTEVRKNEIGNMGTLLETSNIFNSKLLENNQNVTVPNSRVPLLLISNPTSFNTEPITTQPLRNSVLPSAMSVNIITPPSLFVQALSKINKNSIGVSLLESMQRLAKSATITRGHISEESELSTPNSLTSAPPSYSFVLRQMTARRPRLMGTFIPSPSFIHHTPPPNYAAAFDIYMDSGIPPLRARVYNFGFTPMPIICPECGVAGMTVINSKITICTHLCAVLLCLFCCWCCVPLPYLLKSCKDVYHYCGNCRNYLGMYCPTNPESSYQPNSNS